MLSTSMSREPKRRKRSLQFEVSRQERVQYFYSVAQRLCLMRAPHLTIYSELIANTDQAVMLSPPWLSGNNVLTFFEELYNYLESLGFSLSSSLHAKENVIEIVLEFDLYARLKKKGFDREHALSSAHHAQVFSLVCETCFPELSPDLASLVCNYVTDDSVVAPVIEAVQLNSYPSLGFRRVRSWE